MRKVTFIIDDEKYFRKEFKRQNPQLTENQIDDILSDIVSFKAVLTLYGEDKSLDRYELTDENGNQMNINNLNGYQKGVIINDCYAYFEGKSYFNNSEQPCGVIKIIDEEETQ